MGLEIFKDRKLVVATMHGKERLIGPLLSSYLGVNILVPENFNTDEFGAFSGEIKREGTALETARRKCYAAMELTQTDLAVASEGSFGQHPEAFGLALNEEYIVLIDKMNGFEIVEKEISTDTNFNSASCASMEDLKFFAECAGFPEHGLILRDKEDSAFIKKGIRTWDDLKFTFEEFSRITNQVWVETDMRAMHNPKRREVIARASEKLAVRCTSTCPACSTPGYGITKALGGLPCSQCGMPTKSVSKHILTCVSCDHSDRRPVEGKSSEEPMYCDFCNP